ncbi:hypothetical protein BD311DRAFT_495297 [Dichomitus squalens]|uniref:Uncharacterized protein n=1 Tax=Dichomitus squalens TaxID=114155 RepID=A0A4Q9MFR8_9APHY|nr:hypothetical protein BD311DRAFT_495297 [Dichomitus squalens]
MRRGHEAFRYICPRSRQTLCMHGCVPVWPGRERLRSRARRKRRKGLCCLSRFALFRPCRRGSSSTPGNRDQDGATVAAVATAAASVAWMGQRLSRVLDGVKYAFHGRC